MDYDLTFGQYGTLDGRLYYFEPGNSSWVYWSAADSLWCADKTLGNRADSVDYTGPSGVDPTAGAWTAVNDTPPGGGFVWA